MDFARQIHGNFHTNVPEFLKWMKWGIMNSTIPSEAHLIEFPKSLRLVFLKMVKTEEKKCLNNDHQIISPFIKNESKKNEK